MTGGRDVAYMYDSPQRDLFIGRPDWSRMVGLNVNYNNRAKGFEEVYSYAIFGGHDRAELYDSNQKDHLEADLAQDDPLHWAQVKSDAGSALDYLYYVRGFEEAETWSSDDEDKAVVDGATADWLVAHDWM